MIDTIAAGKQLVDDTHLHNGRLEYPPPITSPAVPDGDFVTTNQDGDGGDENNGNIQTTEDGQVENCSGSCVTDRTSKRAPSHEVTSSDSVNSALLQTDRESPSVKREEEDGDVSSSLKQEVESPLVESVATAAAAADCTSSTLTIASDEAEPPDKQTRKIKADEWGRENSDLSGGNYHPEAPKPKKRRCQWPQSFRPLPRDCTYNIVDFKAPDAHLKQIIQNLSYSKFIWVRTHPNGGAHTLHIFQDDIASFSEEESENLAHEFLKVSTESL